MHKSQMKDYLVDDIIDGFKGVLLDAIDERSNELPVFNSVLNVIECMNKHTYTYTLSDLDEKLFDRLMEEVIENF